MIATQDKLIDTQDRPRIAPDVRPHSSAGLPRSVREIVLLSGSVRADRLHDAIGRSVLDLPLDHQRTLLDQWAWQASGVAAALERPSLLVRVMLDRDSPEPTVRTAPGAAEFRIERDPNDYRGTAGVLRDLADGYDEDDYLLVAHGAQYIVGSMADHVQRLSVAGGDVVLVGHRDGTPSGLMLVACRVLRLIPRFGFVDFKEQALPNIARNFEVRVVPFSDPTGVPARTLPDYLAALRMHHRQLAQRPVEIDPFAEDLRSTFQVVENGSVVRQGALLHDSVVLAGATVDSGAVLVRSVVGPRAKVRSGQRLIDRIVTGFTGVARRGTAR